jgi:hypothetical protein
MLNATYRLKSKYEILHDLGYTKITKSDKIKGFLLLFIIF